MSNQSQTAVLRAYSARLTAELMNAWWNVITPAIMPKENKRVVIHNTSYILNKDFRIVFAEVTELFAVSTILSIPHTTTPITLYPILVDARMQFTVLHRHIVQYFRKHGNFPEILAEYAPIHADEGMYFTGKDNTMSTEFMDLVYKYHAFTSIGAS